MATIISFDKKAVRCSEVNAAENVYQTICEQNPYVMFCTGCRETFAAPRGNSNRVPCIFCGAQANFMQGRVVKELQEFANRARYELLKNNIPAEYAVAA